MADEIILHIDHIGYSIREKHLRFIQFIHTLFKVLGKIGNVDQRLVIHDKYNEYYRNRTNITRFISKIACHSFSSQNNEEIQKKRFI